MLRRSVESAEWLVDEECGLNLMGGCCYSFLGRFRSPNEADKIR